MLVLTRKQNQDVIIPELGIAVRVLSIEGGKVRIGIDAPREITILRGELVEQDAGIESTSHVNRVLHLV